MIFEIVGYEPAIVYDTTKPEGTFSGPLDVSLAEHLLGWRPRTDLREGLEMRINWMSKECVLGETEA